MLLYSRLIQFKLSQLTDSDPIRIGRRYMSNIIFLTSSEIASIPLINRQFSALFFFIFPSV